MKYFAKQLTALPAIFFVYAAYGAPQELPQTSDIVIRQPKSVPIIGPLVHPYQKRTVSPINLSNSARLAALIRGGNLYLSAQDLIALVLENNIDIEIQRYGPFMAREVLRRSEGGGFLRSYGTPIYAGPVSVSTAGVNLTTNGLTASGGIGSGGAIVTQIGPTPPALDPQFFIYSNFQHQTTPVSNAVLFQVEPLIDNMRQFQFGYSQAWLTGTAAQFTYSSLRSAVNAPTNLLNPATTGYLDFYVTQNLLFGFGIAVNNRNIRVAKNNLKVSDLQLKQQVVTTVSAVLNLYWDLVSFLDDVRIKEQALATARQFYEDNKKEVALGTQASIELTRAAAEVAAREEDLLISQTNVAQQETVLKNTLSRNGVTDPTFDEVHVIPLDHIDVPKQEDLPSAAELVEVALKNRPEVEQSRIGIESSKILLVGDKNNLRPVLQAFAELTNNGLAGPVNPLYNAAVAGAPPDPYFVGGYGNFAAQLFRRNFPNYSAGFSLNIPFRNRAAQADYVADELSLRQLELQLQRTVNQARVDVKNAIIGLQQARARYEAAVATREQAEQALHAEQSKFQYGVSTAALVVQAQRDLAADQTTEVQASANYTHSRINFDQSVGLTLERNHITMAEASSGRVARESVVPEQYLNPRR